MLHGKNTAHGMNRVHAASLSVFEGGAGSPRFHSFLGSSAFSWKYWLFEGFALRISYHSRPCSNQKINYLCHIPQFSSLARASQACILQVYTFEQRTINLNICL